MQRFRYTTWDGTQAVDLDAEDILAALSDDVLERGDLQQAMRRLMQRGMRGQNLMGLQEMMQRLRERRQQQLEQHNLDSSVDQLQEALEEILRLEKEGIQRRLNQARDRVDPQDGQQGEPNQSGQPEGDAGEQEGHKTAKTGKVAANLPLTAASHRE